MSRLSTAFNINESIRIKEFELGGFPFKVRVPLDKELEDITQRFVSVSDSDIDARITKMTSLLSSEDIKDVDINRENVQSIIRMENKITEYIRLLIPVEGNISDITYEEIAEEFPLQVQLELLTKITEVIQPGYKEARKN
jgi:hypothetical protein